MSEAAIVQLARAQDTPGLTELLATAETSVVVDALVRMSDLDAAVAYRLLDRDRAIDVFESLDPVYQQQLLDALRDDHVVAILERLDPDDRVRLLDEMPAKVANLLLGALSPNEHALTMVLLGYAEESAGRLMSPEFISLRATMTAEEALAKIRREALDAETIYALPVLDDHRHLVGICGLRAVVLAAPETRIAELMTTEVRRVHTDEDQEVAARLVREAGLIALPVVDTEERLVGVITVDDAMEILEAEETEDAALQGGQQPSSRPYLAQSVFGMARVRAMWLMILLAAAALTVNVLQIFEATLTEVMALALFIPLLIDTGGNCGAQASTAVVRAMAVGDVRPGDLRRVVGRELRVGALLGLMLAAVAFIPVALIWQSDLALVVAATLVAICTWATVAGTALPFLARRLSVDPAVVSAPLVTTLVDATGLLIYFGFAHLILNI